MTTRTQNTIRAIMGAMNEATQPTAQAGPFQGEAYRPTVNGRCPACGYTGRFWSDNSMHYACRKCGRVIGHVDMVADRVIRHKKEKKDVR